MKKTYYFLLAILLLLLSCETEKKNPVEGTWELISANWIFADTTQFPNSEYDREVKIIGGKHFLFIRQDTTKNDLFFSGGGTYSFDENKYSETLEFTSWVGDIGSTVTYECQFEGDMWIVTGPIKMEGEERPLWQLHEEWKRIE